MIPKKIRIKDQDCLNIFRELPCVACERPPPSDPAHITSVGGGGDDVPENLISLCREHHREQHNKGWQLIAISWPRVGWTLMGKGRGSVLEER